MSFRLFFCFFFLLFASLCFFLCQFIVARKKMPYFLLWLSRVAADSKTSRSLRCHSGLLSSLIITLYVLCFICFCFFFVYLVASINKPELASIWSPVYSCLLVYLYPYLLIYLFDLFSNEKLRHKDLRVINCYILRSRKIIGAFIFEEVDSPSTLALSAFDDGIFFEVNFPNKFSN